MGKVTTAVVVKTQKLLRVEGCPDFVPILLLKFRWILYSHFREKRNLDPFIEDCPVCTEICVSSTMGLHIGVLCTEELLSLLHSAVLDFVHVIAASIESMERETFAVLICK